MSKEATGENGAVLGSGEYWNRVNRAAFFGTLMVNRPAISVVISYASFIQLMR